MLNADALRPLCRRAVLFLCLLSCSFGLTLAQNENETVGFQSTHIFEGGQFGENIDMLNGSLLFSVPIGPRYQVNSRLGYQLQLTYDSKVWDTSHFHSDVVAFDYEAMPYNEGPNGFGMSLHLGRIMFEQRYMESVTDLSLNFYNNYKFTRNYKWIAPDGSQHEFYFDNRVSNKARFDAEGVQIQQLDSDPNIPKGDPIFTDRKTVDGSYVRVSGPDDKYCYPNVDPTTGAVDPITQHGCFQVRTPDGLVYYLAKRVACDDTLTVPQRGGPDKAYAEARSNLQSFCGWYTTLIEDQSTGARTPTSSGPISTPSPNHVKVVYQTASGFQHVIARVQDSAGRKIVVTSSAQPTSAVGPYTRHWVAITGIDVPGTGTTQSIDNGITFHYNFSYTLGALYKPDYSNDYSNDPNTPVLLLNRIDYPAFTLANGGTGVPISMYFGYNTYGELQCRTPPVEQTPGYNCGAADGSKAAFIYTYDRYVYTAQFISGGIMPRSTKGPANMYIFPNKSGGIADPAPAVLGFTREIIRKDLQAGNISGSWTYDRGDPTYLTNPRKVRVTDPFGNDTIYYYNASPPATPGSTINGANPDDGYAPEWNDGTNYRIDYFQGSETSGNILRSELQEYDSNPDGFFGEPVHAKRDVRVKRAVTRYVDGGGGERVSTRSNWDGFGHWEIETESGFGVPASRTTFAQYDVNCGGVYNTSRLLFKEVSDTRQVLSRTDNSYICPAAPALRGVLDYSLDRTAPTGRPLDAGDTTARTGDVMTKYTYSTISTSGNIIEKDLSTYDSNAPAAGPTYAILYTWAPIGTATDGTCTVAGECGGYLATKTFQNGGAPAAWKAIDRDRDGNTGLILRTRDTAGIGTSYTYDSLGRVKTIAPDGETPTNVDYLDLRTTQVTQGDGNSGDYIRATYRYDTLGRLVSQEKRPADPTRGNSCQRTIYDFEGRVTYKTEAAYVAASTCTTLPAPTSCWSGLTSAQLSQYPGTEFDFRDPDSGICDPFGRARREIPADADRVSLDKIIRTDYTGLASKVTVYGVKGPNSVSFNAVSTFYRDAFNRLTTVDQATGSTDATNYADAFYTYDAADRLTEVDLSNNKDPLHPPLHPMDQYRDFAYDGLGRMLWAQNPENGTTVYGGYDALGNPLQIKDAKGNVQKFYYDFAGRMLSRTVTPYTPDGSATESTVTQNTYDVAQQCDTPPGYSLGKITTIASKDDTGNPLLTETRSYCGMPGGRLSQTTHNFDGFFVPTVTTKYAYTQRGELASITYPQETSTTRTVLQINYTNLNGFVTKASEQEIGGATFAPRDLVTVTYNAAGALQTMTALGGTGGTTTITFDSRNRPKSITGGLFTSPGTGQPPGWTYSSSTYSYDGAGNIYQMGGNVYGYDQANRLISAITWHNPTDTQYIENFGYDIFGNMWTHNLSGSFIENDTFVPPQSGYPLTNRIASRQTTSNPGGGSVSGRLVPFSYDANGNLVEGGRSWYSYGQSTSTEDVKRYQYGLMNRLQMIEQVTSPASSNPSLTSVVDTFGYDSAGNRVWRAEKGTGLMVYSVRDPNGQVLSEFRAPALAANLVEWAADYIYVAGRLVSLKQNQNPRQPVNLTATEGPDPYGSPKRQVTMTWDPNPETNVTYKVYHRQLLVNPTFVLISVPGGVTSTTFVDPTLFDSGQTVLYEVSCVDASTGYESQPSAFVQARVRTGDVTPPGTTTVTAVAGDGSVSLRWNAAIDNAGGVRGYEVDRRTSLAVAATPITSQLVPGLRFVDLNVTNGMTYYYTVRARDLVGNWGLLCPTANPTCDAAATPRDLTPPSPPSGVTAASTCSVGGAAEQIVVSWNLNAAGECPAGCAYDIYRYTQPSFTGQPIGTVTTPNPLPNPPPKTLSFTDSSNLTAGNIYYYAVRASDVSGTPPNYSALSQTVSTSTRMASTTLVAQIWPKASDGKVTLRWEPDSCPDPGQCSEEFRIYRRLNTSASCSDYVQVGKAGWNAAVPSWEFTDGAAGNNVAYDYAVARVTNGVESSLSKPVLAVPTSRPLNLFQCRSTYPGGWVDSGTYTATMIQWTPADAISYHRSTFQNGTTGYLMGYHLYLHKRCSRPFSSPDGTHTYYYDNSPLREAVFSGDPLDPYIVRKWLKDITFNGTTQSMIASEVHYDYQEPRFPLVSSSAIAPWFSPSWPPPTLTPSARDPDPSGSGYGSDCRGGGSTGDANCIVPKAAYKVYANGIWMPVESDWPDYFHPYEPDVNYRCDLNLKSPDASYGLPDCGNGDTDTNFMPPPRKVDFAASSTTLTWQAPIIKPGKPGLAGFYVYGSQFDASGNSLTTFRPPLPFAVLGPNERQLYVSLPESEFYTLHVAAFDTVGHVSGDAPWRCSISGAYCPSIATPCPATCSKTGSLCDASPCPNNGSSGNNCLTGDACTQTLARRCHSATTIPCEVASDCPKWADQTPGFYMPHCSGTTTACNPATPTIGCQPNQVCIAVETCENSPDTSTTVTVNRSGSPSSPPAWSPPFDPTLFPPPQSFRAWAPMNGTTDQKDIYLKWCPETLINARVMPNVTEYDVYRSRNRGGPHKLFAKISPHCLDTILRCSNSGAFCGNTGTCTGGETCLFQGNRCEITSSAACINSDGTPNLNCSPIAPSGLCSNQPGAAVKPCAIVDETFDTYNSYPNPLETTGYNEQFNYYYSVIAKGTVDAQPGSPSVPDSPPSQENAGWLNYFASPDGIQPPKFLQRRDPDGDGEFLVCTNGRIESSLDYRLLGDVPGSALDPAANRAAPAGLSGVGSEASVSEGVTPGADPQPLTGSLAPYRVIGTGGTFTYSPPSKFVFYHDDHLGSPRVEVDDQGVIVATHHYLPFGDERPLPYDPVLGNRAFTGHERDKESGLDYMLARYYSSSVGRFLSPDSRGITYRALVNPQKLNKYTYVLNNPLTKFDPDGMEEVTITYRTYIPQGQTSVLGRTYAGDNRGPSTAPSASSRTTITVRIETDASIRANPIISVTSGAGESRELNANGCPTARATATSGLPTATGTRDANGNAVINIQQDVKNPLSPVPQSMTPGISANLNVTVPQDASGAQVTGTASQFPAEELNVTRADGNTTPVMQYTPDSGATAMSLLKLDRKVDAQASTPK